MSLPGIRKYTPTEEGYFAQYNYPTGSASSIRTGNPKTAELTITQGYPKNGIVVGPHRISDREITMYDNNQHENNNDLVKSLRKIK